MPKAPQFGPSGYRARHLGPPEAPNSPCRVVLNAGVFHTRNATTGPAHAWPRTGKLTRALGPSQCNFVGVSGAFTLPRAARIECASLARPSLWSYRGSGVSHTRHCTCHRQAGRHTLGARPPDFSSWPRHADECASLVCLSLWTYPGRGANRI